MNSLRTWRYFVLGREKTPLPNCSNCATVGPSHNPEACDHLTCHGFYAATNDTERLAEMAMRYPEGRWAVRTGAASDIIVIDAEGSVQNIGIRGVDVLDDFENWTGGLALPTTNLIAETPSGGVHRYYEYADGVRSRNRVLPGVDIKSDGGYVLVPHPNDPTRRWLLDGEPKELGPAVVGWLTASRGMPRGGGGGPSGHPEGYDFERFSRDGCPGGYRDDFFNELIFRMRKSGTLREVATRIIRENWQRAAQPPAATYNMPWRHVEYKIERIWRTVEPDRVDDSLRAWAEQQGQTAIVGGRKVGRVTIA